MREIHSLAMHGETAKLTALLDRSLTDINSTDTIQKDTPLILACQHGHWQIAKILIEKGANSSITAIKGFTALHAALYRLKHTPSSSEDGYEIIQLLLQKDLSLINLPAYPDSKHTVFTLIDDKEMKSRILKIIQEINPDYPLLLSTIPSARSQMAKEVNVEVAPITFETPQPQPSGLRQRNVSQQQSTVPITKTVPSIPVPTPTFSLGKYLASMMSAIIGDQKKYQEFTNTVEQNDTSLEHPTNKIV